MMNHKVSAAVFHAAHRVYGLDQKEYIDKAPVWCSVDLRDGNQALVIPMSLDQENWFLNRLWMWI